MTMGNAPHTATPDTPHPAPRNIPRTAKDIASRMTTGNAPHPAKRNAPKRKARWILYGGSVLMGLVVPALSLWDSQTALMLMLLTGWVLLPAAALLLPVYACRRGVNPFEACWPPVVCYCLGWLMLRLMPPGLPAVLGLILSLLSASTGQELYKRRKP